MDFVVALAKAAAVGEGSPFSSSLPGGGGGAKPSAPAPRASGGSMQLKPIGSSAKPSAVPQPPPSPSGTLAMAPAAMPSYTSGASTSGLNPAPMPSFGSSGASGMKPVPMPEYGGHAATPPAPPAPAAPPTPPSMPATPAAPVAPSGPDMGNEQMMRMVESMAPALMAGSGQGLGQAGGLPLLMLMWDLIGGSRGKNMQPTRRSLPTSQTRW